jgi:hypothetical protein
MYREEFGGLGELVYNCEREETCVYIVHGFNGYSSPFPYLQCFIFLMFAVRPVRNRLWLLSVAENDISV